MSTLPVNSRAAGFAKGIAESKAAELAPPPPPKPDDPPPPGEDVEEEEEDEDNVRARARARELRALASDALYGTRASPRP